MGSLFGGGNKKSSREKALADAGDAFATTVDQVGPGFRTKRDYDEHGRFRQHFIETGAQGRLTADRERIAEALSGPGLGIAQRVGQPDAIERQLGSDLAGGREAYERATFDRAMRLLGPQLERQQRTARSNLVNTGNPIGSERARFELDQLARNQATQRTDLALGSVLAGLRGRGQDISNLNQYAQGRRAAAAGDISNVGNIFQIMRADRPKFFVPGQLRPVGSTGGKKKSGALGTIGTVAGGVIGAYFGGPAGAAAGASIGGAAGNAVS